MVKIVLLGLLVFQSCLIRQEVYLIRSDMKPGWISIEYDNPKCPPLNGTAMLQEFIIPESGFMCTSSSSYKDWLQRSYFLVDTQGKRTKLQVEGNIWHEGVLSKDEPSLDPGQPQCKVSIAEFFYGKKDDLKSNNPIFQDEDFLRDFHPECRHSGVTTTKRTP